MSHPGPLSHTKINFINGSQEREHPFSCQCLKITWDIEKLSNKKGWKRRFILLLFLSEPLLKNPGSAVVLANFLLIYSETFVLSEWCEYIWNVFWKKNQAIWSAPLGFIEEQRNRICIKTQFGSQNKIHLKIWIYMLYFTYNTNVYILLNNKWDSFTCDVIFIIDLHYL